MSEKLHNLTRLKRFEILFKRAVAVSLGRAGDDGLVFTLQSPPSGPAVPIASAEPEILLGASEADWAHAWRTRDRGKCCLTAYTIEVVCAGPLSLTPIGMRY